MIEYKIIKHCRWCRVRYVVNKGESRKYLCDKCQIQSDKQMGI